MVFSRQQRDPLLPGLNSGDSGCFLDTVSQGAAEVCEEFYDTLYRELGDSEEDCSNRRRQSASAPLG